MKYITFNPNAMQAGARPRALARAAALACFSLAGQAGAQPAPEAGPEQLPPVLVQVVSATRHALPMIDAPAALSVVSRAQIEQRGADNLLDALRGEAGVAVFGRTVSGRKTLSLRGMDARHTLFLVDGRRISASDGVIGHSDFQIDWLSADEIERIEVVRGPLSVLYGAEALGGVVNIITRPPGAQWQGGMHLEGSQAEGGRGGDGHRASVRLSGPLRPDLSASLQLADSRRAAIASASDLRISDIEGRQRRDAALQLRWTPLSGQQLDLALRGGREQREALAVERSGKKRVYASDTELERQQLSLGWEADWGGAAGWQSQLRAYDSRIAMSNQRSNGVAGLRPNRLQDQVLEGQLSRRIAAGSGGGWSQQLTAGFESRREGLHNEGLPGGRASARHQALYLQDELTPNRQASLTAGLRADHHQRFGRALSPRLYGVWHLAPQWTLKGGASAGFKPPTLKQISPGYQEDEGPYTYVSKPDLRPEKNRGLELGLGWDRQDAGLQAMVFDNRLRDLIVPMLVSSSGPRSLFRFENVERARLRGLELSGRARLAGGFSAGLNYQYLEAHDGQHQRLEKRPRHSLGAELGWAQGPWRALLRAERSAGQLLASTTVGQPAVAVPALNKLDASLGRSLGPQLDLDLGVSNLGNTVLAERSALFSWAEAPRTWRLGLRGRW
ncbi:TonB-dependent receptor plug domain-containing protein [Paucibacter sp. B51]|uniref:TonB-dependent receptor plug domain-containing protein n=1 Tax=Paucibacter sp. B51 TaxID=2993315 RepID=UPI0022EBF8F4|nr:TonB-dependent receptor [Paucibacter sp. B51]